MDRLPATFMTGMSTPATVMAAPGEGERKTGLIAGVHGMRGLAALAVVFYHAGGSIASDQYQGIEAAAAVTKGLATGVDLFFVISGFVISLPVFLGRRIPVRQYGLHRILRIYPLAMLTALLFLVSNWVVYARPPELASVLSSVFLIPSQTEPTPVVLWTLKQELLFYGVFALAFVHRAAGLALVTLWALASVTLARSGMVSGTLAQWMFNPHNIQFLFGIAAAWGYVRVPASHRLGSTLVVVGLVCFLALAFAPAGAGPGGGRYVVTLGALGGIAVYGAASVTWKLPAVALFLGTASYSIYLIHFFFVSLGNKVLTTVVPTLPGGVALALLAGFAAAGGGVYYLVVERRLEIWRKSLRPKPTTG